MSDVLCIYYSRTGHTKSTMLEIAEALDANVGTIKSRISRGREKLREKIMAQSELFDRYGV